MKLVKNNKAQVGETLTWFVATIVIIGILIVAITIVSLGFKGKNSFDVERIKTDRIVTKSFLGYLLSSESENIINLEGRDDLTIFEKLKVEKTSAEESIEGNLKPDEIKINNEFFTKRVWDLNLNYFETNQILFRLNSEFAAANGGKQGHERIIFDYKAPTTNRANTKYYHETLKLNNWGAKDKNTVLELVLN